MVVPAADADEVFAFIHDVARIDRPHGGLMYVGRLARATRYVLPEAPDEA